jgi:hypothetical protein
VARHVLLVEVEEVRADDSRIRRFHPDDDTCCN